MTNDRGNKVFFSWSDYTFDFANVEIGRSLLIHGDSFAWLKRLSENSIHAVVTDPPYGVKEYEPAQLEKRARGEGGVWRIPPSFDGHTRAPLPRFTALNERERRTVRDFFATWAQALLTPLRPGGHVFIASNTFLSQLVFEALHAGGLEYRGTIMRTVRTLRGGDRPKNFEAEFADVCSLPRGCYEPWGLFRKPLPSGMKVGECLRLFQTGGLRRLPDGNPFEDIIPSTRTPRQERLLAKHPSLKPQAFLRQLVYAALPLGMGIVVDPFMGSGSTVAAAEALGLQAIGVERAEHYFQMAVHAVTPLSALYRDEVNLRLF
jgi:site-specific DNA-methyltransferase (adenine-specific)